LKSGIRKRILARRDALGPAERRDLSERITSRLLALDAYRSAQCVAAYMSFGSELDTAHFVAECLARRKQLVLPGVDRTSRTLKLRAVRDPERELGAGVWGIREPRADLCPEVAAARVEFMLVPGVAFTRRCDRLGYGGGYYDGLIRGLAPRPVLVAAAFALQVVPELPVSPSDQQVDLVVTEDAEYRRPPG
jgi:5-formyltetrahydrofolate cyclo-ligase